MDILLLPEPIRIIARNDPASIASAALIMGVLVAEDKRCSARCGAEDLIAEEYPSFVFVDCSYEVGKPSIKVNSQDLYPALHNAAAAKYAHIVVAGFFARYLDTGGELNIPDDALRDALQSSQLLTDIHQQMTEISEHFIGELRVHNNTELRKLRDLAEMLLACVHAGKSSIAIATLLGDHHALSQVAQILTDYRQEVNQAMNWFEHNRHENVTLGNGVVIVHLREYSNHLMTAGLAVRLRRQTDFEDNTFILACAYSPNDRVHFSIRVVGRSSDAKLPTLMAQIAAHTKVHYESSECAADGDLPKSDEQVFLATARKVMEQAFAEESIN